MNAPADRTKAGIGAAIAASKGVLFHLAVFSFFTNLLMLTGPLYMLQVYDRVLASQSVPTLVSLTILIAALYGTLALLEWVRGNLFSSASSRFEEQLGARAMESAAAASLKDAGRQTERPVRDLRSLRKFLSGPALPAVFDAPFAPLFFIVLFLLHPDFGLLAIFGVIVLIVLALMNQRSASASSRSAEELERQAQHRAGELIRSAEALRAMGMQEPLQAKWQKDFDASDAALLRSGRILSGYSSITKAFRLFLQSAILGLGALLAIRGEVSPGAMIAASILMGRAIAPIEQIVGQWRSITNAHEAWVSLRRFLAAAPDEIERMSLPPIRGHLSVEEVFAGAPGTNKAQLRGISFALEPGDILGILGPSAAGKSTLVRTLVGVWPTLSGQVRLDGADLHMFAPAAIGAQIGYLPQQTDLLSGTVRENISRFSDDPDPADVIAAAQIAACHEMILRLPEGYDTEIGAGGAYLSAGQRQRIGLARALFGNPNFVVLDEPNSNLDGPGEEALKQALIALRERKATTIIVAHRPSAISDCNKLLVLDEGQTRLFGPRDEVLQKILPQRAKATVLPLRPGESNG